MRVSRPFVLWTSDSSYPLIREQLEEKVAVVVNFCNLLVEKKIIELLIQKIILFDISIKG